MHGYGEFYWPGGMKYEGYVIQYIIKFLKYFEDKKSGLGTMKWSNG